MKFRLTLLATIAAICPADVIEAELGGMRGQLIGPVSADVAKNGEGSSIRLKNGAILHAFSRHMRPSEKSVGQYPSADLWPAHIASMVSTDNGRTWTKPAVMFRSTTGDNAMQPSFARLANGEIGVSYSRIDSISAATKVFRYSNDEGKTWSAEILISPTGAYWTSAHDRMVVLSSGRLLLTLHNKSQVTPERMLTQVAYSDDHGRTWKQSRQQLDVLDVMPVNRQKHGDRSGFWEASIAERADGSLFMIGRTYTGWLYATESTDRGETWSELKPTTLMSSAAPGRLERIPGSNDLLIVWNSCCLDPEIGLAGQRLTLSSAISADGGKTWKWKRAVEDVAQGTRVEYPAMNIWDGNVHLTYRAQRRGARNRHPHAGVPEHPASELVLRLSRPAPPESCHQGETVRRRDALRALGAASALPWTSALAQSRAECDVLIAGGSFGGVAAALAAARMGKRVILTEETEWLGGQATTQGVPVDEHPWIESYGRTQTYAEFRTRVRNYYRRHYPLTVAARSDPYFNPGAGWVSACGFEPRVGLAALYEMLAPHITAGTIAIHMRLRPVSVEMNGDRCRAVTFRDERANRNITFRGKYVLDATELGDLLPLAKIEHVNGAESRSDTGEPSAADAPADPKRQQPFTHLIAVDYLPGEDHTIEKPELYTEFSPSFRNLTGVAETKGDEIQLRMRRLFAPPSPATYASAIWNFRRVFYAGHCEPGSFPSDVTMLMNGNEYREGPLLEVPEAERRRHEHRARQLSLSLLYYLQTEIEKGYNGGRGFPGLRPRGDVFGTTDGLAQYPYIRESRRIKAEFTVLEQHFRIDRNPDGPVVYADSVGTGGYRIDVHERLKTTSHTIELHGKHWVQQIPLGSLIPIRVENILPACKNLGVTHLTNGAFRLHPVEWNIGESAGALVVCGEQINLYPARCVLA